MDLRKMYIALVVLLLATTPVFSKVWIVDNTPGRAADFSTLVTAHNNPYVQNGDTLYISGSSLNYGNLTFAKQLVVIGPGYFLDENLDKQANSASVKTGGFSFTGGSEGTIVMGLDIGSQVDIATNNITLKRNRIFSIYVQSSLSNIIISQNYITSSVGIGSNSTNIIITNNYISPYYGSHTIRSDNSTNIQVINTTFALKNNYIPT